MTAMMMGAAAAACDNPHDQTVNQTVATVLTEAKTESASQQNVTIDRYKQESRSVYVRRDTALVPSNAASPPR